MGALGTRPESQWAKLHRGFLKVGGEKVRFKVGDLVRRKEITPIEFLPEQTFRTLQGVVVCIRPIPVEYVSSDYRGGSEFIVEVKWANSYSNAICSYYDEDLILAIEDVVDDRT